MIVKVKNKSVTIDSDDKPLFDRFNWHISDSGYVVWRGLLGGVKKTVRLHRLVVKATDGEIVDHINRNKLDNRKENLRLVDYSTNARNSDRSDIAKHYYYSNTKHRWTVESKLYGIKSLYMDSEQSCIEYVKKLKNGELPVRVFTKRASLSGRKITDEQIDYIFEQYEKGFTKRSISKDIGVSESAVGRVINGITTMGGQVNKLKGE